MASSEQTGARGERQDLALTWLGHSTVRIELDGVALLTDPVLVNDIGPIHRYATPPEAATWAGIDLVLISHCHLDHLDLRSLAMLGADTSLVVPMGAGAIVRKAAHRSVTELASGESMKHAMLSITAIPALHSGLRPLFGPRAAAIGYVVRGTQSVHFAGDTGLFPEMSKLSSEDIDVSLLPVWGWGPRLRGGHLDPEGAVEALRMIRPRAAVPVHWGTFWPRGLRWFRRSRFERPGYEFAELAGAAGVDVDVVVLRPGDGTTF
jgi:L-ascorbate metabolism protein UlaG (beta-lactamase superfamily)